MVSHAIVCIGCLAPLTPPRCACGLPALTRLDWRCAEQELPHWRRADPSRLPALALVAALKCAEQSASSPADLFELAEAVGPDPAAIPLAIAGLLADSAFQPRALDLLRRLVLQGTPPRDSLSMAARLLLDAGAMPSPHCPVCGEMGGTDAEPRCAPCPGHIAVFGRAWAAAHFGMLVGGPVEDERWHVPAVLAGLSPEELRIGIRFLGDQGSVAGWLQAGGVTLPLAMTATAVQRGWVPEAGRLVASWLDILQRSLGPEAEGSLVFLRIAQRLTDRLTRGGGLHEAVAFTELATVQAQFERAPGSQEQQIEQGIRRARGAGMPTSLPSLYQNLGVLLSEATPDAPSPAAQAYFTRGAFWANVQGIVEIQPQALLSLLVEEKKDRLALHDLIALAPFSNIEARIAAEYGRRADELGTCLLVWGTATQALEAELDASPQPVAHHSRAICYRRLAYLYDWNRDAEGAARCRAAANRWWPFGSPPPPSHFEVFSQEAEALLREILDAGLEPEPDDAWQRKEDLNEQNQPASRVAAAYEAEALRAPTPRAAALFWGEAANRWYDAHRFDRAEDCARRALDQCRHYARLRALNILAALERDRGHLAAAAATWKAVAGVAATFGLPRAFINSANNLGTALIELGDVAGALAAYRAALGVDPGDPWANRNRTIADHHLRPMVQSLTPDGPSHAVSARKLASELARVEALPWVHRGEHLLTALDTFVRAPKLDAAVDAWVASSTSEALRNEVELMRWEGDLATRLEPARLARAWDLAQREPVLRKRVLYQSLVGEAYALAGERAAASAIHRATLELARPLIEESAVFPTGLFQPRRFGVLFARVAEASLQDGLDAFDIIEEMRLLGTGVAALPAPDVAHATYEVFVGEVEIWTRLRLPGVPGGWLRGPPTSRLIEAQKDLDAFLKAKGHPRSRSADPILGRLSEAVIDAHLRAWLPTAGPGVPLFIVPSGAARNLPWSVLPVNGRALVHQVDVRTTRALTRPPAQSLAAGAEGSELNLWLRVLRPAECQAFPLDHARGFRRLRHPGPFVVDAPYLLRTAVLGGLLESRVACVMAHGGLDELGMPFMRLYRGGAPKVDLSPDDVLSWAGQLPQTRIFWASCRGATAVGPGDLAASIVPTAFPDAFLARGAKWVLGSAWVLGIAEAMKMAQHILTAADPDREVFAALRAALPERGIDSRTLVYAGGLVLHEPLSPA